MNDYARQTVASLAYQLLGAGRGGRRQLIKQLLPYCVVRVSPERMLFLLLNREHKPLGWPVGRKSYVDYSSSEFASWLVRLSDVQLASFGHSKNEHGEFFYLYGGDTAPPPWRDAEAAWAYCERLSAMFKFTIIGADGAA